MDEEREIGARNFILCRGVTFDAAHPEAPYTLHNLLSTIRPNPSGFVSKSKPIFAYVEYFGPAGDYEVWIDLVTLEYDAYGEETEVTNYGPFLLSLRDGEFVHGRFYCLRMIPLRTGGIYEFQLRIAGMDQSIITQTIFVEE